jgi:hypothetical protein
MAFRCSDLMVDLVPAGLDWQLCPEPSKPCPPPSKPCTIPSHREDDCPPPSKPCTDPSCGDGDSKPPTGRRQEARADALDSLRQALRYTLRADL